jgi:hypothetical protein
LDAADDDDDGGGGGGGDLRENRNFVTFVGDELAGSRFDIVYLTAGGPRDEEMPPA